ncbi:MAG: DUF1573 domain-containing protein [bacterium]|nr:DUF1573 domain-containing protein [bacterium]
MPNRTISKLTGFILTMTLAAVIGGTAQAGTPRMEISTDVFNFGYAPQHAKISHSFWLKSAGDDTLKIVKVTPGCGCTKAPLDKDVLLPGDSARLEIIFSTKTYRNRITKAPKITTNEGGTDRSIKIMTHVVSRPDSTYPIVISPYKLDMSQFTEVTRDRISFTLENVSDQEIRPTLVYAPNDIMEVSLPELIGPGEKQDGMVLLNKQVLDNSFEKSFTIELNDEKNTRFTIPIKRTVRTMSQK